MSIMDGTCNVTVLRRLIPPDAQLSPSLQLLLHTQIAWKVFAVIGKVDSGVF